MCMSKRMKRFMVSYRRGEFRCALPAKMGSLVLHDVCHLEGLFRINQLSYSSTPRISLWDSMLYTVSLRKLVLNNDEQITKTLTSSWQLSGLTTFYLLPLNSPSVLYLSSHRKFDTSLSHPCRKSSLNTHSCNDRVCSF